MLDPLGQHRDCTLGIVHRQTELERLAQRPKENQHIRRQRGWLFHGGEMAPFRHHRPVPDVGVNLLGDRAGRSADFLGKGGIADGNIDRPAFRDRPRAMQAIVIGPEG